MNNNLDNPYYYLENFRFVLAWVMQRYANLLKPDEIDFIEKFPAVSVYSQALLVRMVMRRGNLFRANKLTYDEIGDTRLAAQSLVDMNWIRFDPVIAIDQLYGLLTKTEFARALRLDDVRAKKKTDLLESVPTRALAPRCFSEWYIDSGDALYEVCVADVCDRIRLMFFGNLYQDWSEFVLADLGIFNYEKVPFSAASRAFQERCDIELYLQLHACRERLEMRDALPEVEEEVEALDSGNPWLQGRRQKLLFQIGQEYERQGDHASSLRIYARCSHPGSRARHIRVLEKEGQISAASALAEIAAASPEGAEEDQHLARIMPRLQRKLGLPRPPSNAKMTLPRIDLVLPGPDEELSVEEVARRRIEGLGALSENAPVYYVENTLINSLFGLLCWDAIFSPVPGAFFHPFQIGPADLHGANFRAQRAELFQLSLSQLGSQQYRHTIRETFNRKAGIISPFVSWGVLNETLLEQALTCLPAHHLEKWFHRILDGIATNRNGFPDLIQLWPTQARYRMIEVKGPGDRLQDNQIRFLDFCLKHEMPVAVCYVEWESANI